SKIRPEWMILTRLPILPPDLRPMIQLDGGRFAASDLNDLYRRVINRNNRLRRLLQLGAPEVICRNEKRMLQEAVDTLLNNSPRAGRSAFMTGNRRRLKSLSDMLKGKQGRFRQNLLGKRVDYSGRSVIVVGPELKIHQCGIPKEMAMKLFKPFVIGVLIREEHTYNVKGAERMIQANKKIIWDILDRVTKGRYVLLNRAPTLHRLGIQAFEPVLIEGKAIQLHPLVCGAFNADFDGDQMAVHLPLSEEAQKEARELICARHNVLKPSSGQPIISPVQDMILGSYFLTSVHDNLMGEGKIFKSVSEAINVYRLGGVDLQAKVKIRVPVLNNAEETIETSVGRAIFNSILPTEFIGYKNYAFDKKKLEALISEVFQKTTPETTAEIADSIKKIGYKFATVSGLSISVFDFKLPEAKGEIIAESEKVIKQINKFYDQGIITDNERYHHTIKVWAKSKNDISKKMVEGYETDPFNHIYYTISSGARGNWGQVTQMSGIKGLVANPGGKTIELPIKSNLIEGFTVLEYFNATHGGRKGKSDTALKTAEAGYLTRRLVDAVQDIIVRSHDCGTTEGLVVTRAEADRVGEPFEHKVYGRTLLKDLYNKDGELIGKEGEEIDQEMMARINQNKIEEVSVRSIMYCQQENGVCQKCYGRDLAYDKTVDLGTPVGIIAAQAIGEPGTQLTMRTFHTGGVAEGADITQGLTRVEELFEARPPKTPAVLSEIDGLVTIVAMEDKTEVHIQAQDHGVDAYPVGSLYTPVVAENDMIVAKQVIARSTVDRNVIRARVGGRVSQIDKNNIYLQHGEKQSRSYIFKRTESLKVDNGDMVKAGQPLSSGHYNLRDLINKTTVAITQNYILNEVQSIYSSQGQGINDKHIEIIVKQMFSKAKVLETGDSTFLPGEVVDYVHFCNVNRQLVAEGKEEAKGERLLLGLTRVSLATDSWLSAASFQETIRVLVEASITRRVDTLDGLKENVIIGKPIPAGHIFRERLGQV
ncbi:MAG TPA: DNA-directed RNA polymerase subunit beta', partial [Candidatus Gracilibacteria bacterium]|nr:DNA-directed RNA polymerase subunit beta' [Candidatus Gracilibacteria bacterium]